MRNIYANDNSPSPLFRDLYTSPSTLIKLNVGTFKYSVHNGKYQTRLRDTGFFKCVFVCVRVGVIKIVI